MNTSPESTSTIAGADASAQSHSADRDTDSAHCISRYRHAFFPYFDRHSQEFSWEREATRALLPVDAQAAAKAHGLLRRIKGITVERNRRFEDVLRLIADESLRVNTWVTGKVADVYRSLHAAGAVVTYEALENNELVGALLAIDVTPAVVAGETMVQTVSDASKACFCHFMIDAFGQQRTVIDVQKAHPAGTLLHRFGEFIVPIERYLELLGHRSPA
jgi:Leu/Phe-tRNA-protein transferase